MKKIVSLFTLLSIIFLFSACSNDYSDVRDLDKISFGDNTELVEETLGEPYKKTTKTSDLVDAIDSSKDSDLNLGDSDRTSERNVISKYAEESMNLTLYQYKYERDKQVVIRNIVTIKDNDEDFVLGYFDSE